MGAKAEGRVRISKRTVDALQPPVPGAGEARIWDSEIAGFCVRAYATGRKVYAVKYRVDGRQRWFTIGAHGSPWTPDEARAEARKVLGDASRGSDAQSAKAAARREPTIAELVEAYLVEGPASKPAKRGSSWANDASNLRRHVVPLLGPRPAHSLSREDLGRMARAIERGETAAQEKTRARGRAIVRGGAGVAARTLATTSAMLTWAMESGRAGLSSNPARGVRLARPKAKERFLTRDEAEHLLSTITLMEEEGGLTDVHADAFRLLLFTGARKSEIAALSWVEVDLPRKRLVLPPGRTKAGARTGERRIALSSAARELLQRRSDRTATPRGAGYVFPAARGAIGHTKGLQKAWERLKVRADKDAAGQAPASGVAPLVLKDLRIHDLRHSFASFAVAEGASLFLVGRALGHADVRTTERYAHLQDDPLLSLAESVGLSLGEKL